MGWRTWIGSWPAYRQLTGKDRLGLGAAVTQIEGDPDSPVSRGPLCPKGAPSLPEFFCEVSPELAAERGLEQMGWATIISARNAIEARVMVTRRMKPLDAGRMPLHQIGLPWHWGPNSYTTGDAANELAHLSLDPNVHIQEVKALASDIRLGRRPRRPALRALVREYQHRAGITDQTGTEM